MSTVNTVNLVKLIGRLGKAPELKKTTNGVSVVNVPIALDMGRSKDGQNNTDWESLVLYRQSADYVANYADKGTLVAVIGHLQTRHYERDGRTVYVTEVIVDDVKILADGKGKGRNAANATNAAANAAVEEAAAAMPVDVDESTYMGADITDDQLPF